MTATSSAPSCTRRTVPGEPGSRPGIVSITGWRLSK
jgi:hypothetical protein